MIGLSVVESSRWKPNPSKTCEESKDENLILRLCALTAGLPASSSCCLLCFHMVCTTVLQD